MILKKLKKTVIFWAPITTLILFSSASQAQSYDPNASRRLVMPIQKPAFSISKTMLQDLALVFDLYRNHGYESLKIELDGNGDVIHNRFRKVIILKLESMFKDLETIDYHQILELPRYDQIAFWVNVHNAMCVYILLKYKWEEIHSPESFGKSWYYKKDIHYYDNFFDDNFASMNRPFKLKHESRKEPVAFSLKNIFLGILVGNNRYWPDRAPAYSDELRGEMIREFHESLVNDKDPYLDSEVFFLLTFGSPFWIMLDDFESR